MRSIQIKNNHTPLDICLSYTGSIETVFEFAKLNGLNSITAELIPGEYYLPEVVDEEIVTYFLKNGPCATASTGSVVGSGNGPLLGGDFSNDFNNDFA